MTTRRDNRQEQELRSIIQDIPGNDRCADCEASNPAWASYSLGVFLCTRCASIHRKNSDMSKVKSVSLDLWQPDQVQHMREVGNTISNYKYNPLREWPIHDDDQTMERFIRDKYERKKFMSQHETGSFTPVKSAMKGSQAPVSPAQSSSAAIKYSGELDMLREMGFTDRLRNLDVLKSVKGDVASATDVLVRMESTDGKTPPRKPERPRVRFTDDTIGGLETPVLQSSNPFDVFGATMGAQAQNPFSSIPPSLYGQAQPPGMLFQGAAEGQQMYPPVAPLRQQLTGGQPLRPQSQAQQPQYTGTEQTQQFQPIQPLTYQLTGKQPQQIQQPQQQQPIQAPASFPSQNIFAMPEPFAQPQQISQPFRPFQQDTSNSTQSQQYINQPIVRQQTGPARPPQQQLQSNTSFMVPQPTGYGQEYQQLSVQPPPRPPLPAAGLRPAFKPTVDLNAPIGQGLRHSAPSPNNYLQPGGMMNSGTNSPMQQLSTRVSPQHSGLLPPKLNDSFGHTFTSPLKNELSSISQSMHPTPNYANKPMNQGGQYNQIPPSIQQQNTGGQGINPQFNTSYSNLAQNTSQYQMNPQNNYASQSNNNGQFSSNTQMQQESQNYGNIPSNFQQQPLYSQNTASQSSTHFGQPQLFRQNTGSGFQPQSSFGNQIYAQSTGPGNASFPVMQQSTGTQGINPAFQQGPSSLVRQSTGGQGMNPAFQQGSASLVRQNTGGGINPAFTQGGMRQTFSQQTGDGMDKSRIMALYGSQGMYNQAYRQ